MMMSITRYDPFGELIRTDRDLDRLFWRLASGRMATSETGSAWIPTIDVVRQGEDLVMKAELPGLRPEDIDVSVSYGVLTVRGERRMENESVDEGYVLRERRYGSFERSLRIPAGVDPAAIKADFRDGLLEVTVPRAVATSDARTVKVEVVEAEEKPAVEAPPAPQTGEESATAEEKAA